MPLTGWLVQTYSSMRCSPSDGCLGLCPGLGSAGTACASLALIGALVAVLIIDGLCTTLQLHGGSSSITTWTPTAVMGIGADTSCHGRIVHWLLLGFAIGMALWAKYFRRGAGGAADAVHSVRPQCTKAAYHAWLPWLAIAVALLVTATHLLSVPAARCSSHRVSRRCALNAFDHSHHLLLTFGPARTVALAVPDHIAGTQSRCGVTSLWLFLGQAVVRILASTSARARHAETHRDALGNGVDLLRHCLYTFSLGRASAVWSALFGGGTVSR